MKRSCLWVHSLGQTISEVSSSPYYSHSEVRGGGAGLCEGSLYGAIVQGVEEQQKFSSWSSPFKPSPLHLISLEETMFRKSESMPWGRQGAEHTWGCLVGSPWLAGCSQQREALAFGRVETQLWTRLSTGRSHPCCTWCWLVYLWVSRGPPERPMSLPNTTTAQLLVHMSRNGTSGVQGSLRLECEPLRSSGVSRIRW